MVTDQGSLTDAEASVAAIHCLGKFRSEEETSWKNSALAGAETIHPVWPFQIESVGPSAPTRNRKEWTRGAEASCSIVW